MENQGTINKFPDQYRSKTEKNIYAMCNAGISMISTDKIMCDIYENKHTFRILKTELSESALYCIDFEGVKRHIMVNVGGEIHL